VGRDQPVTERPKRPWEKAQAAAAPKKSRA